MASRRQPRRPLASPRATRRASLLVGLVAALAPGCTPDRGTSDGGSDDGPPPVCANRIRDPGETDTDCGGSCSPCDDGARCLVDGDCASGSCAAYHCGLTFRVDAPRAFEAGPFPTGIAAGDADGDGRIDLLVSLRNELSISSEPHLALLPGRGDGTFKPPLTFVTPGFPSMLAVGDWNGDKLVDVALPDDYSDKVAIVLADGAGGFKKPETVTGAADITAIGSGDFDGDGQRDLVLGALDVHLLAGDGSGRFGTHVRSGTGWVHALAVGDFNGDQRDDVAAALDSGRVAILVGEPGPALRVAAALDTQQAGSLVAGDFDRDGHVDLAVLDRLSGAVAVQLGKGDGTFRAAASPSSEVAANALLVAADLDGDKILDVATVNAAGQLVVFPGKGDGGFGEGRTARAGTAPTGLVAADLDGDGRVDLAAANAETDDVTVLLSRDGGRLPGSEPLANVDNPLTLLAADFDGDRRDDLVTGSVNGGVSVHLARAEGGFRGASSYWVGGLPDSMLATDMNGDGSPELVVAARTSRQVSVLVNDGKGAFTLGPVVVTPGDPSGLAAADLDGEGTTDLAVVDHANGAVQMLLQRGKDFGRPEAIQVGAGAFAVSLCDLDSDGKNDMVVSISGSGRKSLAVLLARGDRVFGPAITSPFGSFDADANASAVICRDLDGRGAPEVIAIDAGSAREQNVSVLSFQPDGKLKTVENDFAGPSLASLSLGPLHRRGRLHALVAGPRGIGLLVGDGSAHFEPALTYRLPGASFGATFGDFDGDGRSDVAAIVEGFPTRVTVLFNR